jgi:hypothetical protein
MTAANVYSPNGHKDDCSEFHRNPLRVPCRYFNYSNARKVVGLERGPLSLVSTTEELLDRKVAAPV